MASSAESNFKKRSLNQSDFVNDDDDDDSESSASELLTKRLRPNFLNDVEQSMLLAQLETTSATSSQSSLKVQITTTTAAGDADSIVSSSGASVSEKENGRSSATKAKSPRSSTPSSKSPAPKKSVNTIQTTLFSPDANKQPAARKATPDSQKKRGRPPKVAADGAAAAVPPKNTMKTPKAPKASKAMPAKKTGACGLVRKLSG